VSFAFSGNTQSPDAGCQDHSVTTDTTGVTYRCTVKDMDNGGTVIGAEVTVKRDATPPTLSSVTAARGPDVNGWYNHAVGVTASGSDATSGIASCTSTTYSGPDSSSASVSASCTDNAGNVSSTQTLSFQYDATGPSVSATAARGADANGWYNHPVDVTFTGSDSTSGIDSCTSGNYSGPDSGSASVSGSCKDKAGNSASGSFGLKYDATAPTFAAATPDRAPDENGWYNHKVTVTYTGTDATSGIASCDAPAYDGPDKGEASVSGHCTDNAGNVSNTVPFAFKFDSTPPKLTELAAAPLDKSAKLTWSLSPDAVQIKVQRTASGATKTVYDGKRTTTQTDKNLRNGLRYTYTITASDVAGNDVVGKVIVSPSPPLYAPRNAARVHGAPLLRWRPVKRASYYNVQLWLRSKKTLTLWPGSPSLRLPRTWSYLGGQYKLAPGKYTWFVWPGFGARNKHKYGPLIGKSTFVVAR
jgi:hypothetical protein